jgi:ATP-dependent RNA/DNA helicase IGHMBP2
MDGEIRSFVDQQKEWLAAELQASRDPTEEGRTQVLAHLQLEVTVGLYGRTVLELGLSDLHERLPAHRFTVGSEVEVRGSSQKKGQAVQGVVSCVTDTRIAVAVSATTGKQSKKQKKNQAEQDDDDDDQDNPYGEAPFSLVPRSSVEVNRKLVAALTDLAQQGSAHAVAGGVVRALFTATQTTSAVSTPPSTSQETQTFRHQRLHHNLDDSQVAAIQFCLSPRHLVSLIHGPPGTGKTTTVVELIRQAVHEHQWRVLVTAPSNVAVDNLVARLVGDDGTALPATCSSSSSSSGKKKHRLRVVRLGHPARVQANILPYSLEAQVQAAHGTEIVADVRKELTSSLRLLSHPKYETRALARREVRQLRKEVRQREEGVVKSILRNAQVVLATCVGAAGRILNSQEPFDLVVIDEAAQALEASCWIPILRGKRLVLAGDHCQLSPTIQSSKPAVVKGLGMTLFERLMHLYGDHLTDGSAARGPGRVSRMLRVQYRMNQKIADWASQALYGGQLQTHESVARQTLADMIRTDDETEDLITPLLLLDTAGCGMHEQVNAAGSRFNEGEGELVRQHVEKLVRCGLQPQQIAVITPYNGQVETLRNLLLPNHPKLEIRSVDGFQGGERPVVVLSLVRSSPRGGMDGIGFLKEDRRLNVAVTRAQRHCCVVADSDTVSQSPFIRNLLRWIEDNGESRSALEYGLGDSVQYDLAAAEAELSRMMQTIDKQKDVRKPKEEKRSKELNSAKESAGKLDNELADMIHKFAETGISGSELRLSTELSSHDRLLVHELAETLGVEHHSEGTDGVDRRIILSVLKTTDLSIQDRSSQTGPPNESQETESGASTDDPGSLVKTEEERSSKFDLLVSEDEEEERSHPESAPQHTSKPTKEPTMNQVLGSLARQRAQHNKERRRTAAASIQSNPNPTRQSPKSKNKKKAQNVGSKKPSPQVEDKGMDDLDDMAFLDAQIDKVQNSHGRTVSGKGGYKSIVNGILLARPKEREAPKNTRAALQSKLKDSQDGRKAKLKSKKKK